MAALVTSLLIVTPNLQDNSTGRAYVWWLLAKHLDWDVRVLSFEGDKIWAPLQGTDFARATERSTVRGAARARILRRRAASADVVVAVKPLPSSLGVALSARARSRFPLIVDIDDPDLEARLHGGSAVRRILWRVRYLPFWLRVRDISRLSARAAVVVSNPVLKAKYGGTLVPHARHDPGEGARHTAESIRVAFVGTVRSHKGIDVLRDAVSALDGDGSRLILTAPPPPDARAGEDWVGEGSLADGERLVAESDVVALPSLPGTFAEGQLPAKLIDAMIRGRVVVVSAIDPMPWAVGVESLCVEPGSAAALTEVLSSLRDPTLRAELGRTLRQRALAEFSVDALAPRLESLYREASTKT
jgi:glycosyltransferase involved in cell wall biosynthesis